jgi:hypothetical protein
MAFGSLTALPAYAPRAAMQVVLGIGYRVQVFDRQAGLLELLYRRGEIGVGINLALGCLRELVRDDLACVYALSSAAAGKDAALPQVGRDRLREQYAARAVELLGKAQAAGFFKNQASVDQLKKDTDLDSVRSRTDFQKLLGDLDMNLKPGIK